MGVGNRAGQTGGSSPHSSAWAGTLRGVERSASPSTHRSSPSTHRPLVTRRGSPPRGSDSPDRWKGPDLMKLWAELTAQHRVPLQLKASMQAIIAEAERALEQRGSQMKSGRQ